MADIRGLDTDMNFEKMRRIQKARIYPDTDLKICIHAHACSVGGGIDAPMQYYQQYLMPQGHHSTLADGGDLPIHCHWQQQQIERHLQQQQQRQELDNWTCQIALPTTSSALAPAASHSTFEVKSAPGRQLQCTNCSATTTPLWRRNLGQPVCNFFLWVPGIVLGLWYCFGDMFNGCKKESVGFG
uniref:GATA-type domain-containing protein n=1 Tax=Globodera rostochiensis TaxID=31243 RepID=A0A914HJ66_GLORO